MHPSKLYWMWNPVNALCTSEIRYINKNSTSNGDRVFIYMMEVIYIHFTCFLDLFSSLNRC